MKKISVGQTEISEENKTFLIAEMSANHLQDLDRAKQIIREAKQAGADAVKLQTYRPDTLTIDCRGDEFLATPGSPWEGMNLYELYQQAYMPWEWHEELFQYAHECGIICFSSPFDFSSVDLLSKLDAPAYKIASFEMNDIPLIKKVAAQGKPVIMSTGVASLTDIELAVETCRQAGNDQYILLKCVSEYPTPYEEINLKTLESMRELFDCPVGLSDHSLGSCVAIAATAMGAKVIEKHFTLRREDGGPDSSFSMEPEEFHEMVEAVRKVEKAMGRVSYTLTERQKKSRERSRSLYIVEDVRGGEKLTAENVRSVRPGYGLHPKYYESVLGKTVNQSLKKGTALKWEYIC